MADSELPEVEKEQLLLWLDADQPPTEDIFEEWKQWLYNHPVKINPQSNFPLTEYATGLISTQKEINTTGLQDIEYNLGMQVQQYKHLFKIQTIEKQAGPSFDIEVMKTIVNGDTSEIQPKLDHLWQESLLDWQYLPDNKAHRRKVKAQLDFIAQQGLGALAYPKSYGGENSIKTYGQIFEQLIYADPSLSIKFGVQFGLFGGSIANLGSKKHHDRWLTDIGKGKILGCFAMTEENHGSNVRGLKTTATYIPESDTIEINTPSDVDYKVYIGNTLDAQLATVFAQLLVNGNNCGVHAIVVPLRDTTGNLLPGIQVADNGYKGGLNGVDNGKIWFHQVQVPAFNLLDRFGGIDQNGEYQSEIKNRSKRFFVTLSTLIGGRICVGQAANASNKLGLSIAIQYGHSRRQFGAENQIAETILMDYPSHQMRLIPRLAKTYALHFALKDLMEEYSTSLEQLDKRKIETQAAALKVMASNHANDSLQECREACGGKGFMSENRLTQLRSDIDIFSTFEGDNHVLLQLAAKGILSEFQTEFNANSFLGVIKYLKSNWTDSIVNYNPLFTNKIDANHLFSREFHREAFTYRRRRLTFSLAGRMQRLFKKRIKPYQAFLKTQTHMLTLAEAYAEELVLNAIQRAIANTSQEKEKMMLKKISAMYALHTILEHKAWYLEQGYISANKSKAIRQLVHRQAQLLTPDALALIEVFDIPKKYLDLPILQS
ncbi:acyl-CoA dehydrogenase [Membranihabitans marinus]